MDTHQGPAEVATPSLAPADVMRLRRMFLIMPSGTVDSAVSSQMSADTASSPR